MPASSLQFPGRDMVELHVVVPLCTINMSGFFLCLVATAGAAAWSWALPSGFGVVWRWRGHSYSTAEHHPTASLGHCSGERLAAIKPCQRACKVFLKCCKAISTFLPSCHLEQ